MQIEHAIRAACLVTFPAPAVPALPGRKAPPSVLYGTTMICPPCASAGGLVIQFLLRSGPRWRLAARNGNRPSTGTLERAHEHFVLSSLSFETYAIQRPSGENCGVRSSDGPFANTVGFPGRQPDASSPSMGRIIRSAPVRRIQLLEREKPPARMPRTGTLRVRALGEALRVAGLVHALPIRLFASRRLPARRGERDARAIGRPDGIRIGPPDPT